MADTRPNIVVAENTVADIYAATVAHPQGAIAVGTQINVKMIENGSGLLYAGAALAGRPSNATGYRPIGPNEEWLNDAGDSGAFIWSDHGCTISVKEA